MQETDIVLLLYRIKVNIRKVEGGDREILEDISSDFLQLMELLKLFLISEKETYYGYFLMNMSFKVDFETNTIAGIVLNEYPPIFASNPLLLCKFSLKEILFIICHEIEHIILNHPAEMLKANPSKNPDIFMRFNYAADASVNDRLIHEIKKNKLKYMSFPNGCVDSKEFASIFNLSKVRSNENYKYYFDLINDKNTNENNERMQMLMQALEQEEAEENQNRDNQSGKGSNEEANIDSKAANSANGEACNSGVKDDIVTAKNCNKVSNHDWECGSEAEVAQEMTKEFVNDVVDMMSQKTRDTMPASFLEQVEKFNRPAEICWEKVLKKYAGTITAGSKRTRTRLNRRQPERFDLSGKIEDKILKIVVAIDTSGSMNREDISRIFNEIFSILSKKKFELTIIECDSKIHKVYKARKYSDIDTKVNGRGGTEFTPVIEYINNDRYYRDALLIYFTDGYGEEKIPRPKTYRNMWVILGNVEALSLQNPYGIVIGM